MYYNGNSVAVPAPAGSPAISVYNNISFDCKNVDLYYGSFQALKGINLRIEKNQITALIGPSGCGKSTFLRSLNRMNDLIPSCRVEGEILLAGVDAYKDIDPIVLRRHVGMVFQQFNLFPQYTALENVTLAERLLAQETPEFKKDKKAILTRIDEHGKELLDRMGLAERMNHYPHQLSGGQQQRVAIARALALKPDILCFDEPTSALDPELTGEVLKVIRSLAQQNTTMIIVTHEMAFARDVADQVIFMDGGVIVEHGDPHEVIDHPKEERTRQFLTRYANG